MRYMCIYYKQKHNTNGMAKSGDTIQIGREGWMAMEPEARIAPPEGNGEPLENMSGGTDGMGQATPSRPRPTSHAQLTG